MILPNQNPIVYNNPEEREKSFLELAQMFSAPREIQDWAIYLDTTHNLLELIYPDWAPISLIKVGDEAITQYMKDGIFPRDGNEAVKLLFSAVVKEIGWPTEFKPYEKEKKGDDI